MPGTINCTAKLVASTFKGSILYIATRPGGEIRVHKTDDSTPFDSFPNLPSGVWTFTCQHIDTITGLPLGPVIIGLDAAGNASITVP
jgi:hypothetical protein